MADSSHSVETCVATASPTILSTIVARHVPAIACGVINHGVSEIKIRKAHLCFTAATTMLNVVTAMKPVFLRDRESERTQIECLTWICINTEGYSQGACLHPRPALMYAASRNYCWILVS